MVSLLLIFVGIVAAFAVGVFLGFHIIMRLVSAAIGKGMGW